MMILEEMGYTPEKFIYKIVINTTYGCRCAYVGIQDNVVYRDLNFVKNECFKLSKQIKEINDAIETR